MLWASLLLSWAIASEPGLREAEWLRDVESLASMVDVTSGAKERAELARALGRLRHADALAPLARLLRDEEWAVQQAALDALAWTPGGEVLLREVLDVSPGRASWGVPTVRQRARAHAFWSLGHHGEPEDVSRMVVGLGEQGPAAEAAARGLGRMGRDGIEAARDAVPALLVAAGSPRRTLAASASYALGRIGCPPEHVQEAAALARAATQSMARGYLLRSIREHADLALREALLAELSSESATFPRIEVLGLARDKVDIQAVKPYLEATDVSVRVAAVAALGRLDSDVSPMLAELAGDEHAWVAREAADALVSRGAALPPTPALSEAQRVASLVPSHSMESVLQMALEDSRAVVRSAACARILDPTPTEADGLRPEQLQPLLDSADPVVRACGVQALAGLQPAVSLPWLVRLAWQDEDSEVRYEALKGVVTADSLAGVPRDDLARAMTKGSQTAEARFRPLVRELAATLEVVPPASGLPETRPTMEAVELIRSAVVFTNRGSFRVELDASLAPYAVWSFAALAERDFFDGIPFHRVVPGFVVQTGCPRGDGWGGPGYAIPDEVSTAPYGPGVVGMARSDRDTAGSQWFITVTDQPHLVGDYTVFGKVTRGMDVVQSMQWSDRILDVRIERVQANE